MAYTILKSDGTVLTTIADGTINTTSTSLGLPGRNYAGYGQSIDTNFVRITENFASSTPPANPLRGQLWFNTNNSTLFVCPSDGQSNALAWLALTATSSGGNTTFGAVTVNGNLSAGNITSTGTISANALSASFLTISANATIADANITTANIGTLRTTIITTGAQSTPGTLTGTWTVNGSVGGNALVLNGNLFIANVGGGSYGIKTDNYYYANGVAINFAGSYSDSNVAAYLPTYVGQVGTGATIFRGTTLTTGANTTAGSITGNWSLTTGSRLNATYADLAERFHADEVLDPGTVVEIGGTNEVTAVKLDLSNDVFGVVSNTAAYLMNASAGNDETHPPIALAGRVMVKVTGIVLKGQRLVSAGNGIARAAQPGEATVFNTIGRALADKLTDNTGTVEAIVMIR
jgi:hypothetical protein